MSTLPVISPQYAEQPVGVVWPTDDWPRDESPHPTLERIVDEMFTNEDLAVTNAVLIIKGGNVLVERYGGVREFFDRAPEPVDASTPLLSWSMAKSILHMLIGVLVERGDVNPDSFAPVLEWSSPDDPRHNIRIRDLLAMRDGLDFVEEYEIGRTSDVIEMLFGQGKNDVAGYTAARPLAHKPDTVFNYSSGTTNVLSRIVADIVGYGDAYRTFIETTLFQPLGMASAEATFDESGVFVASSYVHATALDFAKFGLLYLRGGRWNGTQLVPQSWVDTAQIPLSADPDGSYYSWQWWVTGDQYGTYWASGYEGQMISVVPALDALILRFGHTSSDHYPDMYAWRERVLEVLAKL